MIIEIRYVEQTEFNTYKFPGKIHRKHMRKIPKSMPPTNEYRVTVAAKIVEKYAKKSGLENDELETQVSDLVSDLRHFCAFKGVPFSEVLRRSENHFTAEVTGEPD